MSMKHPQKFHIAADRKRRANRARIKDEARARRQRLREEQQAAAGAPSTGAPPPSKKSA